jgi:hypothetical protein
MSMDFFTGTSIDFCGTSLQGKMNATKEAIEAVFGRQNYSFDPDDKVTTEWVIEFDDGMIATIYDWKRYEQGAPRLNERYMWHIGGASDAVVARVTGAMRAGLLQHA